MSIHTIPLLKKFNFPVHLIGRGKPMKVISKLFAGIDPMSSS
jgi:hypothetical protein